VKPITTLGFIGLGVMGEPMCLNLVTRTSLPVHGTDLKREPVERLGAKGLKAGASVAGVAAAADCVFLSLHSPKAVEEVCGALAAARTHTIVDMSTTPVRLTRELHARFAAQGITLVDAPVAGMRAIAAKSAAARSSRR
jgi:3-hydroxyisobutyrate dehydrogenase-like beta-hydroxyacid dehydrogenase